MGVALNLTRDPQAYLAGEIKVGDLFPTRAKGPKGKLLGTAYWLVLSVRPATDMGNRHTWVTVAGLNKAGEITSACVYGNWAFDLSKRLGCLRGVEHFREYLAGSVKTDLGGR